MKFQMSNLLFWPGLVLFVVLVTIFYQPPTAKTGSLLIWQDGQMYVLDIDSLERQPVGAAPPVTPLAPSPGCLGQVKAPCWVAVGSVLYRVGGDSTTGISLPLAEHAAWTEGPASWSPDGLNLAYTVTRVDSAEAELRVYQAQTGQAQTLASGIDPEIAVAWSKGCAAGLTAAGCQLGFKVADGNRRLVQLIVLAWAAELRPEYLSKAGALPLPQLVTLTPLTGAQQVWPLPVKPIFELQWAAEILLYSQPRHYFHRVGDNAPAYQMSPGSQLANMSPNSRYTVYYEPFTQKECQAERPKGGCWYLGVWLASEGEGRLPRQLIYSRELSQAGEGRLNSDPFWSPDSEALVLFREGRLIYYNLKYREAAIWAKNLDGQLTGVSVFAPAKTAVAFVTHQANSTSYHLHVLNPEFKPLTHVIEASEGVRLLAWLP